VPPAVPSPSEPKSNAVLSSEDLASLKTFFETSINTIRSTRHRIREVKAGHLVPEPRYPPNWESVMKILQRVEAKRAAHAPAG
jgi:hypothetical protein